MFEFFRRIHYLLNRRRLDEELANDMEFHREMARQTTAQNNFGNMTRLREQAFEATGWTWLDRSLQDLRYGVRMLARAPGFTLLAVVVLGVGIGVNIAAFSLFDVIALKPLPVRDADRIVRLERRCPDDYTSEMPYPSFLFYRQHATTLSAAIAVLGIPPVQIEDDSDLTSASFVTENYFSELGARAEHGRLLDIADEGAAGKGLVVVLSYGIWKRRFGGDPEVVGRVVHVNGKVATIVGVTTQSFASLGGQHPDRWMPISQQPYLIENSKILQDWTSGSVRMWGKLAPGVTVRQAEQELRTLTDVLRAQQPDATWKEEYLQVSPGGHFQVMATEMYQVAALVGLLTLVILIVSCANLGGLMLARGVARKHEIVIRIAIGAARWRIFRQLLTESLMLASLGAFAGLLLACAVIRFLLTVADAPGWVSAVPDWRVMFFTVGMTFAATVCFGLTPAPQSARQRKPRTVARHILVGIQIAGSCVLIIVAALLVRAARHVLFTDPGFDYRYVISVDPQLGKHSYSPERSRAYFDQIENRVHSQPGVAAVALVKLPPLGHIVARESLDIRGRKVAVYPNFVTPDFFRAMEIPLLTGRTFLSGEQNVAIVSQSFARQQWPGENPLGQRVGEGANRNTVIGVVGDAHINALSDNDAMEQYWAAQTSDLPDMVMIVRSSDEPGFLMPMLKSMSEGLAPEIFPEIRQLKILYGENVKQIEAVAAIVSFSGAIAVLLAGVGVLGLVAFVVTQRKREMAIRIALGAQKASVVSAVVQPFLWPVALGTMVGAMLAALISRFLRVALYGVSNFDPLSYGTAIGALLTVALIATIIPAVRSLRGNVASILRHD